MATLLENERREELTRLVLVWLRDEHELDITDLPDGHMGSAGCCPIARALETKYGPVCVEGSFFTFHGSLDEQPMPPLVQAWAAAFDDGKYLVLSQPNCWQDRDGEA